MKKIFSIIALVALTFAGCSKADVDTITSNTMEGTRTVSITLVGADDTATRTTLSNDSSLTWCEGDQIAYFIDKGTRQVATVNADGTFNITLDAEAHTVHVNYPVVTDPAYNNAQYYTYPNALSTTQTQPTLGVFEGKNLPFLGSVAVAAGEEPTSVKATYAIKSGAVMSFLIKCDNTQYLTETLTSLVLTSDGKPTYTVILPNDKTIADAVGKKIYCVIEKGTYSNLLVTLNTTTASYRCSTDLATKNGGTIATGDHDSFSLKIDKSETVQRASASLSIKVGTGELTDWNGTTEGAQAAGLTSGALLGTDAEPVVVKIVTGGVTTMTNAQMKALTAAIYALDNNSSIVLDMSDVKAVATTTPSEELFYEAFYVIGGSSAKSNYVLREFVFPTDQSNINSLYRTFFNSKKLTSVSALPLGVTNMEETFSGCAIFNQPITIPAGVTNMKRTFFWCYAFNQPITIPFGVTLMSETFSDCTVFNQSITIPSNVTDIRSIFSGCTGLNGVTIKIDSTTLQDDLTHCFYDVTNTNTIDLILSAELYDAISDADLAAKQWAIHTWKSITKPVELRLGDNWNGTAEDAIAEGLNGTLGSDALPLPVRISSAEGTTMTNAQMKALVGAIRELGSTSRIALDMSAVKAVATTVESQELLYNAFRDTGSLEAPALKEFVFPTDQSNITSLKYTFYKCPNLTSVSPLPSGVKTLSNTFNSCLSFNQPIEIPSSVTDMAGTFQSCSSFNQPIEIPSGVTTITYMLYSCRLFNQSITIPASVTNISMAFKVTAISGKTITIKSTKFDVGGVQGTNTFETYNTPTIDLVLSPALYGAISAENLAAKIWEKVTWKSITQAQ